MNGDYIELADAGSQPKIVDTLSELLSPLDARLRETEIPAVMLDDYHVMFVEFSPNATWSARLAIGNLSHNDLARRAIAESVYRTLHTHTDWTLQWTSDSSPAVIKTPKRRHDPKVSLNVVG